MTIQKYTQGSIRVMHSLRLEPAPGTLSADGSYISQFTFPELFLAIGNNFQPLVSGVRQWEGNLTSMFKVPDVRGKFIEPVDTASVKGIQTSEDASEKGQSMSVHVHDVTLANTTHAGVHIMESPEVGTTWGRGDDVFEWYDNYYVSSSGSFNSTSGGNHRHTVFINAMSSGGEETRPKNIALPTYISAGRWSDRAILYVPDGAFTNYVDYNEVEPVWEGCASFFARQNIHVYRAAYPAAYPDAVVEVERQIELLSRRYKHLYVVGVGSGANIGAKAVEGSTPAEKYVGINGIYNFTSNVEASYYTNHVNLYLGTTDPGVRAAASPVTPSIPYKVWHGNNNTTILPIQATAWAGGNATVVASLEQADNLVDFEIVDEILTFLNI